jgi:hypothetical protein
MLITITEGNKGNEGLIHQPDREVAIHGVDEGHSQPCAQNLYGGDIRSVKKTRPKVLACESL